MTSVLNLVPQHAGAGVVMRVRLLVEMYVLDVPQCAILLAKLNVKILLDMHV